MEKKNIKICDVCEKVVAESKCFSCKKDICHNCWKHLQIGFRTERDYKVMSSWDVCKRCNSIIEQMSFEDKEFNKELKKLIEPYLTKKMILENLEDKKPDTTVKVPSWGMAAVSGTFTVPCTGLGSVAIGTALTNAKAGKPVKVKIGAIGS